MPVVDRLESFREQQAEGDVQTRHERDCRGERRVELLLRLPRPFPVEVVAWRRQAPFGLPDRVGDAATASPGGVISAFCEPEQTTSTPQASISSGTAPRLETASTTTCAPEGRIASVCAWRSDDAGRRLRVREQHRSRLAELGQHLRDVPRLRDLPPLVASGDVAAVALRDLDPRSPSAARDDHDAAARERRDSQPPIPSRRCRTT